MVRPLTIGSDGIVVFSRQKKRLKERGSLSHHEWGRKRRETSRCIIIGTKEKDVCKKKKKKKVE